MKDEIMKKLDAQIDELLVKLKSLTPGTDEYEAVSRNLDRLYSLRIKETQVVGDIETQRMRMEIDKDIRNKEIETNQSIRNKEIETNQSIQNKKIDVDADIQNKKMETDRAINENRVNADIDNNAEKIIEERRQHKTDKIWNGVEFGVKAVLTVGLGILGYMFETHGHLCSPTRKNLEQTFKPKL